MAVDDEDVVVGGVRLARFRFDLVLAAAVDRIVFQLIGELVRVGRDIDHADDVNRLAEQTLIAESLENQAANSAETVDTDFEGHLSLRVRFWIADCGFWIEKP